MIIFFSCCPSLLFKLEVYLLCGYTRAPCVTILCSTPATSFYGRGSDNIISKDIFYRLIELVEVYNFLIEAFLIAPF